MESLNEISENGKQKSLDMEIFMTKSNQGHDVLYISRRQLLSAKYVKQIDGKLLPHFRLVQQVEIGPKFMSFTSTFELASSKTPIGTCLGKPNGLIGTDAEDVLQVQPKLLELFREYPTAKNYIIGTASPISFKGPEDYVSNGMRKDKEQKQIERYVEKKQAPGNGNGRTSKSCEPNWKKNWDVELRQRQNGKFDKYYYHKETKIMCRSLVEVDNYELLRIRPTRPKKTSASEGGSAGKPSLKRKRNSEGHGFDDGMCPPSNNNISGAELKTTVESFLRESYENLLKIGEDEIRPPSNPFEAELSRRTVENFLREAHENLLKLSKNDSGASNGKREANMEEISEENEGKSTHRPINRFPLSVSFESEDRIHLDDPVTYMFDSP